MQEADAKSVRLDVYVRDGKKDQVNMEAGIDQSGDKLRNPLTNTKFYSWLEVHGF